MPDAPLMLSVSGARGLVGRSLTPDIVSRYAAAFGSWLRHDQSGNQSSAPHVVLGRDSRPSGELFAHAAAAGLAATGCRVTLLGIASTPGVAIMTQHLSAQGGMVITASHNPIPWNGIKCLRSDGVAPPADQAKRIIERFQNNEISYAGPTDLPPIAQRDDADAVHCDVLLPHLDVDAIRAAKLKVVLDSVHGAGGREARMLLDHLGVEVAHLFAEPTGLFPHEPEPTAENLTGLCAAMGEHKAHVGFAQDPDADRLAVVDENGIYIGEEYTLALCAKHRLRKGDTAVANLSTSRMLDDIAAAAGASVARTAVGEANVAAGMREHKSALGGEGNGGIIFAPISYVRDSLVGIGLILEMLAQQKKALSKIVSDIPAYAIVKTKVPVSDELVQRLAPTLKEKFADQKLDTQDGVRVDWPDRWVHVRPSNTEPILRLIAEARTAEQANELLSQTRGALGL